MNFVADSMAISPHRSWLVRIRNSPPRLSLKASFGLLDELANLVQFASGRLMLAKKLRHQRNHSAADILHQGAQLAFHYVLWLNRGLISSRRLLRLSHQALAHEAIETG